MGRGRVAKSVYGKLVLGKRVLDTFAFHYETGEKIPTQLFNKLIKTKNFNTGLFNIRQIEFALFDFGHTC